MQQNDSGIGEFPNISTDNSIALLREAMEKYSHIREVIDFDRLETPEQAFYARLTDIFVGNFMRMVEREGNENKEGKS